MPFRQAQVSKSHGRSCKSQIFVLVAIEWVWKSMLEGFWGRNGSIFGFKLTFRSDFESKCYKVWFLSGAEVVWLPPPIEIFSFGPQCERETGRASQADVTPYGVGGHLCRCRRRKAIEATKPRDPNVKGCSDYAPASGCEAFLVSLSHWVPNWKL